MTAASFADNLAFGREAEDWVEARMRALGFTATRLRDLPSGHGHGPRLQGPHGLEHRTLDYRFSKQRVNFGMEVKRKSRWSFGEHSRQDEHGIPFTDWETLRAYEEQIEPAFLIVLTWPRLMVQPQSVVIARGTDLRPRLSTDRGQRMTYFPRDQFDPEWQNKVLRHVVIRVAPPRRRPREQPRPDQPPDQGTLDFEGGRHAD
jgi:hypothetical protein